MLRLSVGVLALAARVQGLRLADDSAPAANATEDAPPAAGAPNAADLFQAAPEPPVQIVRGGPIKWTYFPPEPRMGVVMGGDPEEFARGEYGHKNELIMREYAKRKGMALYIDKNIGRHTERGTSWSKLHVLHQLVDDVPLLVWMDPSVVITRKDFSFETLIKQSQCNGIHQSQWEGYLPKEVQDDTFLWLSAADREGGSDQYLVNTAPGLMVLRRGPEAKEFLEKVWHAGDKPGYFMHHKYAARTKEQQNSAWPYEQGAMWDVLASMPDQYLRKACIPKPGYLLSLDNHNWKEHMMLRHLADKTHKQKNDIVSFYFSYFNLNKTML